MQCDNFILQTKYQDKWFLSKERNIVAMEYAQLHGNEVSIFGFEVKNYDDYFDKPISSSRINVFHTFDCNKFHTPKKNTICMKFYVNW